MTFTMICGKACLQLLVRPFSNYVLNRFYLIVLQNRRIILLKIWLNNRKFFYTASYTYLKAVILSGAIVSPLYYQFY